MRLLKLLLIVFVFAAGPAVAGPFEEGFAAYERGDYATARGQLRPLADRGNALAQNYLGMMYSKGQGVPQDYAAAMTWYRKAAEQGSARAKNNLGIMYSLGQGVPQDYAAAMTWYRKAADQNFAFAQSNLGDMYANGQGVPQDYAQAVSWYRKASDQGNAQAQKSLQALLARAPTTGPNAAPATPPQRSTSGSSIPMKKDGGIYVVPVLINNAITLDFMVDSGASDVSIPEDVVTTLIRAGTIRDTDFIGQETYKLADGSKVKSETFRIRSLKVGDRVLENVTGSVAGRKGTLLLGQSFLGRFKSWSIDNTKHLLVLE